MKKILIADDNEDIIDILSNYIEREGYETVVAMDGEEALQLFEKEQPILVLLDIMMPKDMRYVELFEKAQTFQLSLLRQEEKTLRE